MAMFGSSSDKAAPAPAGAGRAAAPPAAGLSIIGAGMTVQGDVETAGVVKVEGTIVGHVRARQQVLVAKGGQIDGDIDTAEAVIGGLVHGAVAAQQRVEIQAGATVQGDVTTRRIAVAEGAVLNGMVKMREADDAERPAQTRPAPVAIPQVPSASAVGR